MRNHVVYDQTLNTQLMQAMTMATVTTEKRALRLTVTLTSLPSLHLASPASDGATQLLPPLARTCKAQLSKPRRLKRQLQNQNIIPVLAAGTNAYAASNSAAGPHALRGCPGLTPPDGEANARDGRQLPALRPAASGVGLRQRNNSLALQGSCYFRCRTRCCISHAPPAL